MAQLTIAIEDREPGALANALGIAAQARGGSQSCGDILRGVILSPTTKLTPAFRYDKPTVTKLLPEMEGEFS